LNCTVIISCGKTQLDTQKLVPLYDLYTGRQTRLKIRLARAITSDENIYVISGKLGLVPLAFKAKCYDSNNRMPDRKVVEKQIKNYKLKNSVFYIGQRKYFRFLQKLIPDIHNLIHSCNCQDFCSQVKDSLQFIQNKEMIEC